MSSRSLSDIQTRAEGEDRMGRSISVYMYTWHVAFE